MIELLTESNNSKAAANKTKRLIAQTSGLDANDPMVAKVERIFEDNFFGAENYSADWFIVLEPNAYSWAYGEYGDEQEAKQCLDYAKKIADNIFPESQINMEYCEQHNINYDGTVSLKKLLSPEQLEELKGIKAPYREKRNEFITQVRQINDLYQADSFLEPTIEKMRMEERRITEKMTNGENANINPNYEIVGPLTRLESKEYGDKSGGNGSSEICYTQGDTTWDNPRYSNDDKNKLFILLSKDWKDVKPEHDGSEKDNVLGAPYNKLSGYDRYGMSMIFLWVTPDGTLHSSNTRWNHSGSFRTGDVDEAFTQDDIERLMGCSLPEITKIIGMADKLDEVKEKLANGEDPKNLFDEVRETPLNGVVRVKLGDKYNFLRENGTFLWDKPYSKWLDDITIICGSIEIVIGRRTNFLRPDGTLVWNKPYRWWFNYCDNLSYGFFAVWVGNKVNFIKNNLFIWDKPVKEWFDDYRSGFVYGNAVVKVGRKCNFLKEDGTLLWKNDEWPDISNWFDYAEAFRDVIARVAIGENLYYIGANGEMYDISYVIKVRLADGKNPEQMLNLHTGSNKYGKDIVLVSFRYGYNNTKYNFLRPDNTLVWDKPYNEWFDQCDDFSHTKEPCVVVFKQKYNFLKEDGTLLWKNDEFPDTSNWFDGIFNLFDNSKLATVAIGFGSRFETYYIDINGVLYDKDKNVVSESKKKMNSKKLIHLNESTVGRLFLTESKNSNRAHKQTRRIIAQYMGANENDPSVIKAEQTFEAKMFAEGKRTDWMIVLEPFAYNWYIQIEDINKVKKCIDYIYLKATEATPPSSYIANIKKFNDFNDLEQFIKQQKEEDKKTSMDAQANMEINVNQNYEVRGPLSFDEAKEIGKHSVPNGEICYTQDEGMWGDYSEYDVNNLFVLLRKDWEKYNAPEMAVHDGSEKNNGLSSPLNEFNGYDNYGLSMIFVWIDRFGNLCKSNTRWNHEAKYAPGHGVDTAMTETDIAMLMGEPFEQVFGVKKVDVNAYLEENLSTSRNLGDVFDDLYEEHDGIRAVKLGSKYNYVYFDKQENKYKLLWNKPYEDWFTLCDDFRIMNNEVAIVEYNGKKLFIDRGANLHDILEFTKEKLASGVNLNSLFVNVIDDGGVPVRVTYDYIKINYVNSNTNELLWDAPYEEWLEYSSPFKPMQNYAIVSKGYGGELYMLRYDGKVYTIDEGIRLRLKRENPVYIFDSVEDEHDGVRIVRLKYKYNFIRNGSLLLDKPYKEWFDDVNNFHNGIAEVRKDDRFNFLKLDGTLLWKNNEWPDTSNWFASCVYNSSDRVYVVNCGSSYGPIFYYLDVNGVLRDQKGNVVSEGKRKMKNGKKLIHLSENTVDRLFLTEGGWSKEKKRIVNRCVAIIKHYCDWMPDDTASLVEKNIEHKFFEGTLAGKAKVRRYEPMITKILVSELGYPTSPFSSYKEKELVDVVQAIDKEVTDGLSPKATCIYDAESNKFTCDDYHSLVEKYHDVVLKSKEQKKAEKDAKIEKYANESEYEIVPIPDFATAKKYGNLSSPGKNGDYGRLCYTQGENTWNNYTNNGLNACYLCINKNTWKKWKNGECPEFNEYSPYDEYGLSMIWAFVGPDGSMTCSNTRWNHGAQGNIRKYSSIYGGENCDHSFSEEGITKVTKYPFRECFLPKENAFEDIKEAIYPIKDKIVKELENGTETLHIDNITINKASDNLYLVDKGKKFTFLKINPFGFVFDGLCDNISSPSRYHEYLYVVRSGYKCNLLNEEKGELVLNQWVDNVRPIGFDEYGYEDNALEIKVDGKFNIIDFEGELLFPMWVERYTLMPKFNACVFERDKKYYFYSFDTNSLITDEAFTNFKCDSYGNDFTLVSEDGSFVGMSPNGKIKRMSLSNIEEFVRSHIAVGEYDIDTNSTHMFVFDELPITNGQTIISDDCGYGLQKGMIEDSLYAVYLNGFYNIGCNGKLILPFWLNYSPIEQQYFDGKVYTFKKNNKINVVTKDGMFFDGPIEQWPCLVVSVEGINALVLCYSDRYRDRENLTDFNRFMYDLNTPIEDLPTSISIVGHCAIVRHLDNDEGNYYNLFDLDSWSFIFDGNIGIFSEDSDYTEGRHLCLVEDRESMLSNFYDTDRKEFILKDSIPAKRLIPFGECLDDMPVAGLISEGRNKINFISPNGEFMFGPDEDTWPFYDKDEDNLIEPLVSLRFRDGYAIANLHKFKLISGEHFKDIITLGNGDSFFARYFELIRQDGSKVIYDCEEDVFVRSNLDADNHFEGYDGTSLIDYLNNNFCDVHEFIPGQVYSVGKHIVGKVGLKRNLVTVSNSGKPLLILPEWFDYISLFNNNSNLVKCTNMTHTGCKIFNLSTMEFVTDRYVTLITKKMSSMVIEDLKDKAANIINSNGELVFKSFILTDVEGCGNYLHTNTRFLKLVNMEGDFNVYDFKNDNLVSDNWVPSIKVNDTNDKDCITFFFTQDTPNGLPYHIIREDGVPMFTSIEITNFCRNNDGNTITLESSDNNLYTGNLETGEVSQLNTQSNLRTESRKTSGKIIRISNDKLNKLFIY